MKIRLVLAVLFCISVAAYGGARQSVKESIRVTVADSGTANDTSRDAQDKPAPSLAPLKPYPRLLPLQLNAPPRAQAGIPLVGVSVTLQNPGDAAPDARLRLIIHGNDHAHTTHRGLTADKVKVEVLEKGTWVPVLLGVVEGNVMGAIGTEGAGAHHERYKRGGFEIPAGLNKTWQLRLTFSLPGSYSLVAAVSPDNGSMHLARPAYSVIEVQ